VLSDPDYADGYGERTFIFNIGVLKDFSPVDIPDTCFNADIVVFGATAVMPKIHTQLDLLLERSKLHGALNIVTTVYDLLQERSNPGKKWTNGSGDRTYSYIDLLVCDKEEAFRFSGTQSVEQALAYFKRMGVKATIVTQGKQDVVAYAVMEPFMPFEITHFPVSELVDEEIHAGKAVNGDTTGCGDNFAGGVLASIAMQSIRKKRTFIDLKDAIIWGIAAGGAACFYLGGTYTEHYQGEKRQIVERYYHDYKRKDYRSE
jgi:sugar/nucleoside kinase (ribokinase family)